MAIMITALPLAQLPWLFITHKTNSREVIFGETMNSDGFCCVCVFSNWACVYLTDSQQKEAFRLSSSGQRAEVGLVATWRSRSLPKESSPLVVAMTVTRA